MRYSIPVAIAALTLSSVAFAGTIKGKVSGVTGESVVWVEAATGKTYPAPTQHVVVDQRA